MYHKFSLNWPCWLLLLCCYRRRWTQRTSSLPPTSTTCCPTSAGRVCQGKPRVSTHCTARPEHECCFQFKGGSRKVPRQCVVISSFPFITIYRKCLEFSQEWTYNPHSGRMFEFRWNFFKTNTPCANYFHHRTWTQHEKRHQLALGVFLCLIALLSADCFFPSTRCLLSTFSVRFCISLAEPVEQPLR